MSPQTKSFLHVFFALFLFCLPLNAQTASPTPPAEDEPEKVFTEEIKLNVSAFDTNGKTVSGVGKEDLVIMEDGRIHQASSVRRIPANVLIVLDTGGENRLAKSFKQTRETAKGVVNALQPQDSVALMQYHDRVEIIAEWTSKEEALKILDGKMNFGRRSVFLSALETATKFLQKTALDNRHLVLITDGTDSFNKLSEREAAMKNLLATDINVHVISYTALEKEKLAPKKSVFMKGEPKPKRAPEEVIMTMPKGVQDMMRAPRIGSINTDREFLRKMRERQKSLEDGEKYLQTLAEDTNGGFILPATNEEMLEKTALIAQMIDSSFVVTYAPKRSLKEAATGEIRNIEVSSRRDNLIIQAKRKLIVQP